MDYIAKGYELTVGATVGIGIGCIVAVIGCAFGWYRRSKMQLTKGKSEKLGVSLAYLLDEGNGFEKDAEEAAQKVVENPDMYNKDVFNPHFVKLETKSNPNFYHIKVSLSVSFFVTSQSCNVSQGRYGLQRGCIWKRQRVSSRWRT